MQVSFVVAFEDYYKFLEGEPVVSFSIGDFRGMSVSVEPTEVKFFIRNSFNYMQLRSPKIPQSK